MTCLRNDCSDARNGSAALTAPTPQASTAVADTSKSDSTLTTAAVLAKIQSAYMTGIKGCYKEQLKKDPQAKGRVALSMAVNETGRTATAKAEGFSTAVDDWISKQMKTWRFPVPQDKAQKPTTASFSITIQLIPDK